MEMQMLHFHWIKKCKQKGKPLISRSPALDMQMSVCLSSLSVCLSVCLSAVSKIADTGCLINNVHAPVNWSQ